MSSANLEAFFSARRRASGAEGINRSEETIRRYGENTMPGGDRPPAGVIYPASTADVQAIVRAANKHKVPLYPISTGNNIGLGTRSAAAAGQVVVDLGPAHESHPRYRRKACLRRRRARRELPDAV